jgi:hypothetical protein
MSFGVTGGDCAGGCGVEGGRLLAWCYSIRRAGSAEEVERAVEIIQERELG